MHTGHFAKKGQEIEGSHCPPGPRDCRAALASQKGELLRRLFLLGIMANGPRAASVTPRHVAAVLFSGEICHIFIRPAHRSGSSNGNPITEWV